MPLVAATASVENGACDLVLAEWNDVPGVVTAVQTAKCRRVIVYSKSSSCTTILSSTDMRAALTGANATVSCTELPNHGREQQTYLSYAHDYYDSFAERVYFVALPLWKHDRLGLLQAMLATPTDVSFVCDYYAVRDASARAPARWLPTATNGSWMAMPAAAIGARAALDDIPSSARTAGAAGRHDGPSGLHRRRQLLLSNATLPLSGSTNRSTGQVLQGAAAAPPKPPPVNASNSYATMAPPHVNVTNTYFRYAYRFGHPSPCGGSEEQSAVGPCLDFFVTTYKTSVQLPPADVRPLWAWAERHAGLVPSVLSNCPVCFFGLARTTGANLRTRPQLLYAHLRDQLSAADKPEAGHYVERMMGAIYGPPTALFDPGAGPTDRGEGWPLVPHQLSNTFILGMSIGGAVLLSCVLIAGWLVLKGNCLRARAPGAPDESRPLKADPSGKK